MTDQAVQKRVLPDSNVQYPFDTTNPFHELVRRLVTPFWSVLNGENLSALLLTFYFWGQANAMLVVLWLEAKRRDVSRYSVVSM